jgi:TPR repeat protein
VVDSQYNLGLLYEAGRGVEKNLREAYRWFAVAANAGDVAAREKQVARKRGLTAPERGGLDRDVSGYRPAPRRRARRPSSSRRPGAWRRPRRCWRAKGYYVGPVDGVASAAFPGVGERLPARSSRSAVALAPKPGFRAGYRLAAGRRQMEPFRRRDGRLEATHGGRRAGGWPRRSRCGARRLWALVQQLERLGRRMAREIAEGCAAKLDAALGVLSARLEASAACDAELTAQVDRLVAEWRSARGKAAADGRPAPSARSWPRAGRTKCR